jgi:hypothetical protein
MRINPFYEQSGITIVHGDCRPLGRFFPASVNRQSKTPEVATIMHQRLANEFLLQLARRALAIIAPCLREEERRDAFAEFLAAFKEELLRYENERERVQARLTGAGGRRHASDGKKASEPEQDQPEIEPSREVTGHGLEG